MSIIQGMKSKALFGLVAIAGLLACGASSAQAAVVRGVHVTKGKGWVRVTVDAPGASFSVKELPVDRSADYRSIAIDVSGASIAGGLEPKTRVPVNEGLVSQVRVKQWHGNVRVLVDVIAFPRYSTSQEGGALVLGVDTYHMRDAAPDKPKHAYHATGKLMASKSKVKAKACSCCGGKS